MDAIIFLSFFILIGIVITFQNAKKNNIPFIRSFRTIQKKLLISIGSFSLLVLFIVSLSGIRFKNECLLMYDTSLTGERGTLSETRGAITLELDNGKSFTFSSSPLIGETINRKLGRTLIFYKQSFSDTLMVTNGVDTLYCPVYIPTSIIGFSSFKSNKLDSKCSN